MPKKCFVVEMKPAEASTIGGTRDPSHLQEEALLPKTDLLSSTSAENTTTAWDYVQSHLALESEARCQMPYDPRECTFAMGPQRQALYACLTCARMETPSKPNAVCYACSIRCHASHELVELFAKRGRTCDCGTTRIPRPCMVRTPLWSKLNEDIANYDPDIPQGPPPNSHNFLGKFCLCDTPYDPELESNMFQCALGVACDEDWFHEECIMGARPGEIKRLPANAPQLLDPLPDAAPFPKDGTVAIDENIEGKSILRDEHKETNQIPNTAEHKSAQQNLADDSQDEDMGILPGFPLLSSFDSIICCRCVAKFRLEMDILIKRLKCETMAYLSKKVDASANDHLSKRAKKDPPYTVFLPHNYKETLALYLKECPRSPLSALLNKYPFMHIEEFVYEPPADEDSASSLYDLGLRQLDALPADKAALGLRALDSLRGKLTDFFKPFAAKGEIVTEEAITNFFKTEMN